MKRIIWNFKHLCTVAGSIKFLKGFQIGQGFAPAEPLFTKKVEIFDILGPHPTPCADWGEILRSQADARGPYPRQISHESVQRVARRGENADFRPLSKFKYRQTPRRGVLPVNKNMQQTRFIFTAQRYA